MAKVSGKDAAEITPKLIDDVSLLPRDNSGGIDFKDNHAGEFGDGGRVTGPKSHLSASN